MAKTYTFSSESEFFDALKSEDMRVQDLAFDHIYGKIYGPFQQWVYMVNKGSVDDAEDAFQSGLLNFIVSMNEGKIELRENTKITTLIFLFCKRFYINRINSAGATRVEYFLEDFDATDTSYDIYKSVEISLLKQSMNKLEDKCRMVIQLFYFDGYSLKEIAEMLEMASTNAAKQQRYECTEKLKNLFHDILSLKK